MIDLKNFRQQWENTRRVERGYTRVDVKSPECYIGYNAELNLSLIIISNYMTKKFQASKSVQILRGRRDDGRFQLEMNLLDENLSDVFLRMCYDLLNCSADLSNEKVALKKLAQRYLQWQNLFEGGKCGLLSSQEQRGLIGELLFLRSQIIEVRRPLSETIYGWYGPLNEHQDFSYSDKWYEIKTVIEQAEKIQIASMDQLSRSDAGELVIYRLAKTSGNADEFDLNKFTLNCLVRNLFDLLGEDFSAGQEFESRLFQAGYIEREEYDEQSYKLTETMKFPVNDDFPRLLKKNLPSAILSATYFLDIRELKLSEGAHHGL